MADTQVLGTCALRRVGSSPTFRTLKSPEKLISGLFYMDLSSFTAYLQDFDTSFAKSNGAPESCKGFGG